MTVLHVPAGAAVIQSTGAALGERVVSLADLAASGANVDVERHGKLLGITHRHHVEEGTSTSDLAARACTQALAGRTAVDRIILATVSPDHPSPATSCRVQDLLGLHGCAAHDLAAACSGFPYALDAAARALMTGDKSVLVCAAEVRSRFVDPQDSSTAALFGDGAAAALVAPGGRGPQIRTVVLHADGKGYGRVHIPSGGARSPATAESVQRRETTIRMAGGPELFMELLEGMCGIAEETLAAAQLKITDIDVLIPHQPNRSAITRLCRLLRFPEERTQVDVQDTGNMSAATAGYSLHRALVGGRLAPGRRALMITVGGGYTAGGVVLEWPPEA